MSARRPLAPVLIALATLVCLTLAVKTRGFVHPDERLHVAAFQYYAAHWWPPPPNADGIDYDPFGTSKIYALEHAYPIVGRLATAVARVAATPAWLAIRIVDASLLPLALLALLVCGRQVVPGPAFIVVLVAIPQVLYVFSYANSEAWAITASLWLFAWAVRLEQRPGPWSVLECVSLGVLVGLVVGAKDNFVLALVLPAIVLAPRLARGIGAGRLLLVVGTAAVLACPYKILYPALQPDFTALTLRQIEERAAPGHRLDDMQRRAWQGSGHSVLQVLVGDGFAKRTAQSFWGVYGHMTVFAPPWAYVVAGLLGFACCSLTLLTALRRWGDLGSPRRALLLAAPVLILLNFALSLRSSIVFWFQPQGRYLFPSLLAVALLLAGATDLESPPERRLRRALSGTALVLCLFSLFRVALPRLSQLN